MDRSITAQTHSILRPSPVAAGVGIVLLCAAATLAREQAPPPEASMMSIQVEIPEVVDELPLHAPDAGTAEPEDSSRSVQQLPPIEELPRLERLPALAPENGNGMERLPGLEPERPPIGTLTTDIRPSLGELPNDVAKRTFDRLGIQMHSPQAQRPWIQSTYQWEAKSLYHRPLYFEEPNVERHGHRVPLLQPVVSAAHFYARIPALPYLMALDRPYQCDYTLGHRRPGSLVVCPIRSVPLRVGPGAVQTLVIAGLILAIP